MSLNLSVSGIKKLTFAAIILSYIHTIKKIYFPNVKNMFITKSDLQQAINNSATIDRANLAARVLAKSEQLDKLVSQKGCELVFSGDTLGFSCVRRLYKPLIVAPLAMFVEPERIESDSLDLIKREIENLQTTHIAAMFHELGHSKQSLIPLVANESILHLGFWYGIAKLNPYVAWPCLALSILIEKATRHFHEKDADMYALKQGYGPQLLNYFNFQLEQNKELKNTRGDWRTRFFYTDAGNSLLDINHPLITTRIKYIEQALKSKL